MTQDKHLIVFAKNPVLGKVKTRIAVTMGDSQAMDVYNSLLSLTVSNTLVVSSLKWVYYSEFKDSNDVFSSAGFNKRVQVPGDLGIKMATAFEEIFSEYPQGAKVVLIGSDCPTLTNEIIEQAYLALDDHSVVLGPTVDGGYYLVGMKAYFPEIFNDITWSTDVVLAETLAIIHKMQLSVALLPKLNDIDTEADWKNYLSTKLDKS